MITAIDTSVLADVFSADPQYGRVSADAMRDSARRGVIIACDVVFAECAAAFADSDEAAEALARARVDYSPLDSLAALSAGIRWREYRRRGGSRQRVVADFLVGSHALLAADRLLTRDRGFYRSCFAGLEIFDPTD
jgi:predicted nucleic acid-binding protein